MSTVTIFGEKGDKGDTGDTGPPGVQGPSGKKAINILFRVTVVKNESDDIAFSIDGELQKTIYLYRGYVYGFDQSDPTNLDSNNELKYPINISTTNPITGDSFYPHLENSENDNNFTFEVPYDAPDQLYYYCSNDELTGVGVMMTMYLIPSYTDGIRVTTNDATVLKIKPSTIGTVGQALFSDGNGETYFGEVITNPVKSNIDMQNNTIINVPAPTEQSNVSNKSYVDSKINDNEITLTNTWSSQKIYNLLFGNIDSKLNDDVSTDSTSSTWSSSKIFTVLNYINTDFAGTLGHDKVNLHEFPIQPVKGLNTRYTVTGSNIINGQPMMFDFVNGNISATGINVIVPPDRWKFIGITTNSATNGSECTIVNNGFVTARYTTMEESSKTNTIILDGFSNATRHVITGNTIFTDSGGSNGDYSNPENYNIVFDASLGRSINYSINSLEFDHGGRLNARLGVQISYDGVNFFNPSFRGWHTTSSSIPPFGTKWKNNFTNPFEDFSGNVLPSSTSFITSHGGSLSGTFGSRYVKFYFYVNGAIPKSGWNIKLSTSDPSYIPIPIDTPLYLDPDDFTKVSEKNYTDFLVGYCAFENTDNNSIYMRVSTVKQ